MSFPQLLLLQKPYWDGSKCAACPPDAPYLENNSCKSAPISEALHRTGTEAPAFLATTETKRAGLGRKRVPCLGTAPKAGLEGRSALRAGDPELPCQDGEQCVARSLVDLSQ